MQHDQRSATSASPLVPYSAWWTPFTCPCSSAADLSCIAEENSLLLRESLTMSLSSLINSDPADESSSDAVKHPEMAEMEVGPSKPSKDDPRASEWL